jgi:hypothetical protein
MLDIDRSELLEQVCVPTSFMSIEKGRLFNRLFDVRQEGACLDVVSLEAETVAPLVTDTAVSIAQIKTILFNPPLA